jgi:translocation and assembly module TamA
LCALVATAGCAGEKAEGRPWIHNIIFTGLKSISKRDLRGKISVQKTSWIPWAPRKYLDPFALPADRERIEAYYRDHGFFDAHVTAANTYPRKSRKPSVDIEFKIVEGLPTKVVHVEANGTDAAGLPKAKMERELQLHVGHTFVYGDYLASKSFLHERLRLKGYAWAEVEGQVDVERDARTASIALNATPGLLAHIGRVDVEGEDKVRAIDIIRTADLHAGRLYSSGELETARGKVYNVGVFNSVRLSIDHDATDPSIANVKIAVQEGAFHELRIGGGITIESQRNDVHLFAQYTKRNWLGGMRSIRLRLEPGWAVVPAIWNPVRNGPTVAAEAEFKQPFVFGLRHLELHWIVGYDVGIDYAYQYQGPRTQVGLGYALWRNHIQLGLSYNFQFLTFFHTVPGILDDPALAGSLYGYVDPYRVGWWQEDASLDLRDNPLSPHKGVYLLMSVEEGGVYAGSAFNYEKLVPDGRIYVPMGSRLTFATRVQFGQIWTQGDLGSPITRRLYLGGPDSHRGFNYDRLSYQVPSGQTGVPAIPIGGDQSFLVQGEFRLRIYKLFGNWLGAVGFADGGDVALPHCHGGNCMVPSVNGVNPLMGALTHLDFSELHWAVGGGLRYATVIGTIRFDVGVRLNRLQSTATLPTPDPGQRVVYHISVGEAF